MLIRLLGVLAILLLPVASASSNPVPNDVAVELNALPRRVVEGGTMEDRRRLIANCGAHGIDLLDPPTLTYMAMHFNELRDELAESQRPPHAPSGRLQEWYRARTRSAEDRMLMLRSLRMWLDQTVNEAPRHGSMRILDYGDQVPNAVMETRLVAAEFLADWSDRDALPRIRALEDSLKRHPNAGRGSMKNTSLCLRQSILRITEPEHAGFFVTDPRGGIACHRGLEAASEVEYELDRRRYRPLTVEERAALAKLLIPVDRAPSSNWASGIHRLRITFPDGLVAQFSATEPGVVRYEDNSRMTYREPLPLKNPRLHEFLKECAERR
jgi:hypothetical protein